MLRAVEDLKIEATVSDARGAHDVNVEWGGGTGPLALRAVCSCGGSGICEHVVATLETVRSQTEVEEAAPSEPEIDLSWLPAFRIDSKQVRARSVWPVFASLDGMTLSASLVLDSPRLRGAARDAPSIVTMMDSTPVDDWDELDRELMRDESVVEAFAGRSAQRVLSRALFRLSRHPRLRFDDDPSAGRHPSELPEFRIDLRGLTLRAVRGGPGFVPLFETADGAFVPAKGAYLLDGPPTWVATSRVAYLVDGTFDARKAIEAARAVNGAVAETPLGPRTIARVAPFLTSTDRGALGIADAALPTAEIALGWTSGALIATLTFIDRVTGARAPYAGLGAIAPEGARYVRFTAEQAAQLRSRLVDAGFVPRAADAFALHGAERAAIFVRDVLPTWEDLERRLDPGLTDLVRGGNDLDINVIAERAVDDADWFELKVDVFVGGSSEALTQKELAALLSSSGRFAEVRGKLVDVARLRERNALLSDLADRRRSGLAALLALRDELHDNFASVSLPPEVEKMRERLRNFGGIPVVEPPPLTNGALRGYQQRGLDFLAYLSEFGFGGILADEMGLGKALSINIPILTPSGWRRFGDIAVGDKVMNAQGGISRVVGVYPQGELEAFRVTFSDGASTICSDDHLWAVNTALRKSRGNGYRVLTLREIRGRLHDAAGNARHYIPIAGPMRFGNDEPLPIDPYLLGCLLADGGLTQRTILTSADSELVESCNAVLPTGTEFGYRGRYHHNVRSTGALGLLNLSYFREQVAGLSLDGFGPHQKFVPSPYKVASLSDRLSMLQGLMDTDGFVGKDGHVEFGSSSHLLANDVAFLVRSLGGTARVGYKHEPRYTSVTVALPPQFNPFRLGRKADAYPGRPKYPPSRAIVKVEPVGKHPMQCIAVDSPDHLFVVDDFIVTHNTVQVLSYLLRRKAMEGPAPALVIAPTSVTHTWENEIARFAPELSTLRLHSGNERAARYDEVPGADVVITSYALARLDAQQLSRFRFRTLILDEAQNAKNPASQIARVVRSLHAEHRLALTGTPVENSLRDLWAIFAFVEPGLLGTETSFRRRFEIPIAENDPKAIGTLRSRLEPFLLRRTT